MLKYVISLIFFGLMTNVYAESPKLLDFTENRSQWEEQVLFKTDASGASVFFEEDRLTYLLTEKPEHCSHAGEHDHAQEASYKAHAYQMIFNHAQRTTAIAGQEKISTVKHFYLGKDPSKWATNVPSYKKLVYQELYDCIDLEIYSRGAAMKYDFVVKKGGIPRTIELEYEGLDQLQLQEGNLVLSTSLGEVIEQKPYAYQIIDGEEKEVWCAFVLNGTKLSFELGDYDADHQLIIDPTVIFASYSGSTADNWGTTATYDSEGNAYGGGTVWAVGYPLTIGAFDLTFAGGSTDMGISKFSADGSTLLYATYIGGIDSDYPHSLIADADDNLIIFGSTGSSDYPIGDNAYQDTFGGGTYTNVNGADYNAGSDIVITKLSEDGSMLLGSTYIGGASNDGINDGAFELNYNYGDQARGEVTVDEDGRIIFASCTQSVDFPVTEACFQDTYGGGGQDGVIGILDADLSTLEYATFFGGTSGDSNYSIKVNPANGKIYSAGGTSSDDLPFEAAETGTFFGGQSDGFVMVMDADGGNVSGNYVGTDTYDQCYFVDTDPDGEVYVTGQTAGSYPVSDGVYSDTDGKQFIHKFNSDLTSTEFTTVFGSGGSINISPTAFLIDDCRRIYVAGWGGVLAGGAFSSSVLGMTVTADAYQSTTDGNDFYYIVLSIDAEELTYATFFGGPTTSEHVDGGTSRFDKNGVIYQATCACGGLFGGTPTTDGAYATTAGSANCNLHVLKLDMEQEILNAVANASATSGCADPSFTVEYENLSVGGEEYIWILADGETYEGDVPPATEFTEAGEYMVQLIAVGSDEACAEADTSSLTIIVSETESIEPNFSYTLPDGCESLLVAFENESVVDGDLESDYIITWDFGDENVSDELSPEYTYLDDGTVDVTLTVANTDPDCPVEESVTQTIDLTSGFNVVSSFEPVASDCAPNIISTSATSDAEAYVWLLDGEEIGDGSSIEYTLEAGEYELALIASDENACNLSDTSSVLVSAYASPLQDFSLDPISICVDQAGESITISGPEAVDAWTYQWEPSELFIDATLASPTLQLNASNTLELYVNTAEGCSNSFEMEALVLSPTPIDLGPDLEICPGESITLDTGIESGEHSWNGAPVVSESTFVVTEPGTYTVVVTEPGNCVSTDEVNVTIGTLDEGFETDVLLICDQEDQDYLVFVGDPANPNPNIEYSWQDGSTGNSYLVTKEDEGWIWVDIINGFCSTRDSLEVQVFPCVILDVELIHFDGRRTNDGNLLMWSTASEYQCDHFELEASADGLEFRTIGQNPANHPNGGAYSSLDVDISNQYYRLKIVDRDGTFKYSNVVEIKSPEGSTTLLAVYPNPASDEITLLLNPKSAQDLTVELLDVAGRIVFREGRSIMQGQQELSFDISALPGGLYYLELNQSNQSERLKLVVAH